MFRNKFILLAAMFILFAGLVSAYSNLGGGWCGCGDGGAGTGCADCTNALNDNTLCSNGVISDGAVLSGVAICIDDPANFSNKVFDLNGSSLSNTLGGTTGIELVNKDNVVIANGTVGAPIGFNYYGIYLLNVTDADIHNVTVTGTNTPDPGFGSAPGIFLGELSPLAAYTSNSVIYNCTIVNNEVTSPGILLIYVDGNEIWDTTTSSNGHGIWVFNSWNNQIHDSVADNNVDVAIGGIGFYCWGSDRYPRNNTFVRVNASGNAFGGMAFLRCPDSTVDYGQFVSNPEGIYLTLGGIGVPHNVTVSNNLVSGSTSVGIHVISDGAPGISASWFLNNRILNTIGTAVNFTDTDNNTLITNLVRETTGHAYYFSTGADNNTLIENTAHNNTGNGFHVFASEDNTFINSTAYDNYGYGVYLAEADDTFLNHTVFYNNTASDLLIHADGPFDYSGEQFLFFNPYGTYANFTNLSLKDTLVATDEYSVNWTTNSSSLPADMISFENKFVDISLLNGAPSIDTVVWHWLDSELPGYMEPNFEIWKFTAGAWSDEGATLDTAANTLTIANLNPASDYGILQNISVCPVITSPGGYQLQANLAGAPNAIPGPGGLNAACVVIDSDDVYLDCNGYTVTNDGTATATALFVNGTAANHLANITIENCPGMHDYEYGAFLYYTEDSLVQNSSFYNNSQIGLSLRLTNDTNITGTEAYNNSYGYIIFGSDGNLLNGSFAYNNTIAGIGLADADGNALISNFVYNNTGTAGIAIALESTGNGIAYNNVTEDMGHGIVVSNSSDNIFVENRMYDNSLNGIWLDSSHASSGNENIFFDNQYYDNGQSGINITNSTYPAFLGSTIRNNAIDGIYVEDSADVGFGPMGIGGYPLSNLVSELNGRNGIYVTSSTDVLVVGFNPPANNRQAYFRHNGERGIYFENTSDSWIAGSSDALKVNVYNNSAIGVYVEWSDYTKIEYVVSYNNTGNSFYLTDSLYSNISNCLAYDAPNDCFKLNQMDHSTLTNNIAYNCSGDAFDLESNSLTLYNTTAHNSSNGILLSGGVANINSTKAELYDNAVGLFATMFGVVNFTDTHTHNNSFSDVFMTGVGADIYFTDLVIDSPAGNHVNYTNLSLYDNMPADVFTINWTVTPPLFGQAIAFEGFANITDWAGTLSIDEIVWQWTAAQELPIYNPNFFNLVKYNDTGWSIMNDTPDTGARTLSLYNMNPASDYGILQFTENLTIVKTVLNAVPAYAPGAIVEFQLVVNNTGNTTFSNVEIWDELPVDLSFNATNTSPYTNAGQTVNWTIATLAPNTAVIILLNATVDPGATPGLHTNDANVTGMSLFGVNYTNSSNASVQLEAPAIYVQKDVIAHGVYVGLDATYTLNITNTGTMNLTVSVNDTLPAGIVFLESDPVNTSSSGQTIYWTNVELNLTPGNSTIIVYNVTTTGSGNLWNNVVVTGTPMAGTPVIATNSTRLDVKSIGGGDGGSPDKPLEIDVVEPAYLGEDVLIIVTTDGAPLNNADVTVRFYDGMWKFIESKTDSNGETIFVPTITGTHRASGQKSGYEYDEQYFEVLEPFECTSNDDCVDMYGDCYVCNMFNSECILGKGYECGSQDLCPDPSECMETEEFPCPDLDSIPICIDCICDYVECIEDEDCPPGEQCIDYECTGGEEPPEGGCTSNDTCEYDQYCDLETEECVDLDCVCGYPFDHACVYYECCSDPDCIILYGVDYYCNFTIHECEQEIPGEEGDQPMETDVPDETGTGEEVTITVTSNGDPVPDAEVTVYVGDNPIGGGFTDENGQFTFVPTEPGDYWITVSKEGFIGAEDEFVAISGETIWDIIIRGVWIALFILILIAIIYVIASRKKKRRPKDME